MQQTSFNFEVLIHDDASTDGTQEIIKAYQAKYPNIIKPIFQTENQYSQGKRGFNAKYNYSRAQGKYIALCEGDDYWTDPLKLQKQVDFLEANKEYSMCFHKAKVVSDLSKMTTNIYDHLKEKTYTGEEILNQWTVPTASVIFRNSYDLEILCKSNQEILFGDILLFLYLATKGKLYCLKDEMCVYRRNGQGVSVKGRFTSRRKLIHYKTLYKLLQPNFENALQNLVIKYLIKVIHNELDKHNYVQGLLYSKELFFLKPNALKNKVLKKRIKKVLNFN
jgi:glycosyltransferase involved in cell wall biosynthesis